MFENFRVFKTEFAGREMSFEAGKMCGLSNGSCLVRYGETTVLVNVTASQKPRDGIDFFPLSVDFEEKLYCGGQNPWLLPARREGRPSRKGYPGLPCGRPPHPSAVPVKDMRNDVSVVMTVLSVDPDCSPEICGIDGYILCPVHFGYSVGQAPLPASASAWWMAN